MGRILVPPILALILIATAAIAQQSQPSSPQNTNAIGGKLPGDGGVAHAVQKSSMLENKEIEDVPFDACSVNPQLSWCQ
jgi:opacity protein-like surface antigen